MGGILPFCSTGAADGSPSAALIALCTSGFRRLAREEVRRSAILPSLTYPLRLCVFICIIALNNLNASKRRAWRVPGSGIQVQGFGPERTQNHPLLPE